jgi:hypothetical protein
MMAGRATGAMLALVLMAALQGASAQVFTFVVPP